jgi:predicted metal-dependent HD superfamily phosphohydrolase
VAVLIDPPTWPAHGTTYSHVVSDTSLAELHGFAADAGLPHRAFDRDHYDVPARRYEELVAHGALPVSGRELVRRLRASGLRVRARDRPERVRRSLLARWRTVLPGAELLAVVDALDVLTAPHAPAREVVLAAWFHDAVYDGVPGQDEHRSADLARERLTGVGLSSAEVEEVVRLVLLTVTHAPEPDDTHGALLCDADLSVLGRDAAGYARYLDAVRRDYAHVPDETFRTGRRRVVVHLLALDPLFHTERGRSLWNDSARRNLTGELGHGQGASRDEHHQHEEQDRHA